MLCHHINTTLDSSVGTEVFFSIQFEFCHNAVGSGEFGGQGLI
jgi:hypothetical protein